jgi:hypothetical protein
MWPIQFTCSFLISCRIFLCSLTRLWYNVIYIYIYIYIHFRMMLF